MPTGIFSTAFSLVILQYELCLLLINISVQVCCITGSEDVRTVSQHVQQQGPGHEAAKRNTAIMAWFRVCMILCIANTDTLETVRCTPHTYSIFYISGHIKHKHPLRATWPSVTFREKKLHQCASTPTAKCITGLAKQWWKKASYTQKVIIRLITGF